MEDREQRVARLFDARRHHALAQRLVEGLGQREIALEPALRRGIGERKVQPEKRIRAARVLAQRIERLITENGLRLAVRSRNQRGISVGSSHRG